MIVSLVVGVVLLVIGLILRFSKLKRNWYFGYRTPLSIKNDSNWTFANNMFGRHALVIGALLLVLALLSVFINLNERVAVIIALAMLFISILIIEIALRKFDNIN